MRKDEYKAITTELAYLRKEIEELKELKPVEVHYHYTFDYGTLVKFLKDNGYFNNKE